MEKVMKSARFRRTFEGLPISEERCLEQAAEIYRLKQALISKEEQYKIVAVKLHRSQEASKRNLRRSVDHELQTSRDRNSIMARFAQQTGAEERILELQQKLREQQRDSQKYLEISRQSKAEVESLKKMLDATTRSTRRSRASTPPDISRRYKKMMNKLKSQNICLQEENDCLRRQLDDGPGGPETPPSARPEIASQVACSIDAQKKGAEDSKEILEITAQLLKNSDDFDRLKNKYDKMSEELNQLKASHSKCLNKLKDTYDELTQERRLRQVMETESREISGELIAVQHLKSDLQQVRQQNLQLENENAELLNAAINVPRTNFAEIKVLREQLVEELKQRNLAETNAAKLTTQLEHCKRDLAKLAVVEANWQYLKTELEAANKSVASKKLKVTELQDANKSLQKQLTEFHLRQRKSPKN